MIYKPNPIDTTKVVLPADVEKLKEKLAENIHEVWAKQRMEQGWTYGKHRDDFKKTHPNLVRYSQLSEEDKDYDRSTAMETLKTILSLGYQISKSES